MTIEEEKEGEEEIPKEVIIEVNAECNIEEFNPTTTNLVLGKVKNKMVGKPILPFSFGGTSHYGLCDIGTRINVIPYTLYNHIKEEFELANFATTNMTIMLADRTIRIPFGIIKNVSIYIGPYEFPIDLVIVDMPSDNKCLIILGRSFLNKIGANIDCRKESLSLKFGEEEMNFYFSKFKDKPDRKEFEE
jgi:hypothetical protein